MKPFFETHTPEVQALMEAGVLSTLDVRFGQLMGRLSGSGDFDLFLGAALASRSLSSGDVCLDLTRMGGAVLWEGSGHAPAFRCPETGPWIQSLAQSPVVGTGDTFRPLVLDPAGRLYLYRYWNYEQRVAREIRRRAAGPPQGVDPDLLRLVLSALFPHGPRNTLDLQAAAVYIAATSRFCVVAGGPGTGKTVTVAKMLALACSLQKPHPPKMLLAAPTGKAAARLKASIRSAKERLPLPDVLKARIPEEAVTLHRMLGVVPGNPGFRFHEAHPLPVDGVIVDEASMIALPLMAKLLSALPEQAGLVLLGDPDQLASVESGYVLGDICHSGVFEGYATEMAQGMEAAFRLDAGVVPVRRGASRGLSDCRVTLRQQYRFSEESGIDRLSSAVRKGDPEAVLQILRSGPHADLIWFPETRSPGRTEAFADGVTEGYRSGFSARNPAVALEEMERFRILCAVNDGAFGVDALNIHAERVLAQKGLVPSLPRLRSTPYPGRPVVVTRNREAVGLFNGDTGILWGDTEDGIVAVFPGPGGIPRNFGLYRLPEHKTAYAMTVHKSQGSEFDTVFLVLPDRDIPLLTREWLYTGITRARRRVLLWGSPAVIRSAVSRKIERRSGLGDALRGA